MTTRHGADPEVGRLLRFDREHLWHPYTSLPADRPPLLVDAASGTRLQIVTPGGRFKYRFMTCAVDCAAASLTPPVMITVRSPLPPLNAPLPRYWAKPLIRPTAADAPNVDL